MTESEELGQYNKINNEHLSKRIPTNFINCPKCKGKGYYIDSNAIRVICKDCSGKGHIVPGSKDKTDKSIYFRNSVELIGY